MTGFYTFMLSIFHTCHIWVQSSDRDEYDPSDAIDLFLYSGRPIDAMNERLAKRY